MNDLAQIIGVILLGLALVIAALAFLIYSIDDCELTKKHTIEKYKKENNIK